jgi:hypothetical protein
MSEQIGTKVYPFGADALSVEKIRYLYFVEIAPNPKTKVWKILDESAKFELGRIRWFGRWRKYCFFPTADTVFEQDCLRDIAEFIESQTKLQRAKK